MSSNSIPRDAQTESEAFADFSIGNPFCSHASHLANVFLSDLSAAVLRAVRRIGAALSVAISRVVFCGPEKQMRGIAARRIIAAMQYPKGFIKRPKGQKVRETMRTPSADSVMCAVIDLAIADPDSAAGPNPTVSVRPLPWSFIYLFPEPFTQRATVGFISAGDTTKTRRGFAVWVPILRNKKYRPAFSACYLDLSHDLNLIDRLGSWSGPHLRRDLLCGPFAILPQGGGTR